MHPLGSPKVKLCSFSAMSRHHGSSLEDLPVVAAAIITSPGREEERQWVSGKLTRPEVRSEMIACLHVTIDAH